MGSETCSYQPGRVATLQGEDPEEENIGHVRSSKVCLLCVRASAGGGHLSASDVLVWRL